MLPQHSHSEVSMDLKSGTRLSTPALSKVLIEDQISDMYKEYEQEKITEGIIHTMDESCGKCGGFGKSPEFPEDPFCYACEGTGLHYRLYYGVQDGAPFAYTDEWGVDFLKQVCAAEREAFEEARLAGKIGSKAMVRPFRLPKTLEMELQARGYTIGDIRSGKKVAEIANIVASEWPDFMCVTYKSF